MTYLNGMVILLSRLLSDQMPGIPATNPPTERNIDILSTNIFSIKFILTDDTIPTFLKRNKWFFSFFLYMFLLQSAVRFHPYKSYVLNTVRKIIISSFNIFKTKYLVKIYHNL